MPGTGRLFGSTFVVSNPVMYLLEGEARLFTSSYDIHLTKSHYLNEEGSRCSTKPDGLADYNLCYEKYLEAKMNCSIPWRKQKDTALPECNTFDQKNFVFNITSEIETMGEADVYKTTGCSPSCSRREFTVTKFIDTDQPSPQNRSVAQVIFYYSGTKYTTKWQYLSFTMSDFIANIGGNLGLTLGFSMVSLYDEAKRLYFKIMKPTSPCK